MHVDDYRNWTRCSNQNLEKRFCGARGGWPIHALAFGHEWGTIEPRTAREAHSEYSVPSPRAPFWGPHLLSVKMACPRLLELFLPQVSMLDVTPPLHPAHT